MRQDPGGKRWRLFADEYLDVVVWYDGALATGFQIQYDVAHESRALGWDSEHGFSHARIGDGEDRGRTKRCPLPFQVDAPDKYRLVDELYERMFGLDSSSVLFVQAKPLEFLTVPASDKLS
ncbi:MAG: hypothetical protein HY897_23890 [Deltaproteobacteria bacterium]|nr:hypothetical protein [Deltaproteobacteria bacterium]